MCRLDTLDPSSFQKLLMKTGLVLIVIGHLSFISGALVHGTVLRYVANPQDAISLQYAIANIISVTSAILTISCGIAAIVLSRYLSLTALKWAVFSLSISSTLLSLFCSVGLAVSIILTFANKGTALLATCTFANVELIQISHECSFDPTRVYSSTLSLWTMSLILDAVEIIFSIRCFLLTLALLNLKLCRKTRKKKVTLQLVPVENREANEGRVLLRQGRVETVWL
ncbi:transmembrane protein 54 isoform X2 [Trachemys scripta elegans]|uniref:Transmembrane protein 54 n=1 Tax=Chrysemys picta bellii TaxID=8478 RepID=A0A8C3G097_CHRPI|nr:transmembrane protein 54 [Chrysemys picta bellii]XP_034610109.1 transmembrane protein 54 isoform X2 [Trachemys scripta elegans]